VPDGTQFLKLLMVAAAITNAMQLLLKLVWSIQPPSKQFPLDKKEFLLIQKLK
jgi:hypothetical protein